MKIRDVNVEVEIRVIWMMLNQPKKLNAISKKNIGTIFSPNLSFASFVFILRYPNTFWVHVMHVLDIRGM
jgi:hypothetical protein